MMMFSAMATLLALSLGGQWVGKCQTASQTSEQLQVTFLEGNKVRLDSLFFGGRDCAQQPRAMETLSGQYQLGADQSTSGTKDIDLIAGRSSITVYQPERVAELNERRACGHSDWALGQPIDVTDSECAIESPDSIMYNSVRLADDAEHLYFGACPCSYPDMRPVADILFTKKPPA